MGLGVGGHLVCPHTIGVSPDHASGRNISTTSRTCGTCLRKRPQPESQTFGAVRPNVGVNWRSLPSVKRQRALHPAPLSRRQRGGPLRPSAGVPALLEGDARLYQAAARTRRPLCGVARVHAQGHDLRQFGAARRAREGERKRTVLTGVGRYYSTLAKSGTAHRTDHSSPMR